jgi:hypothetical protein
MENKEYKLAYLAGILDGDGSFSLIKASQSKSDNPIYYPLIQCASTDKEVIHFLASFGGHVSFRNEYVAKDGGVRKSSFNWKVKGRQKCLDILDSIIPYLVVKKERASYLRDYIINNDQIRGKALLSSLYLIDREKAYLKMLKFNNSPCIKYQNEGLLKESDEFWAYVAGLMDADGSFSVKKEIRKSRKNPSYTPIILLSMVDCRAIYCIKNIVKDANILVVKAKTTTRGLMYRLSITSKEVARCFLSNAIPFLRQKKEAALTLLRFCEHLQPTSYRQGGIKKEELEYRERMYSRMVQLNKYGVSKSSLIDLETLAGNAEGNKAEAAKACTVNVASEKTSKDDAVL